VDVERGFLAYRGQRRKGRHGDRDVIPDPAGLDNGLAGLLVDELSAQMSDHGELYRDPVEVT